MAVQKKKPAQPAGGKSGSATAGPDDQAGPSVGKPARKAPESAEAKAGEAVEPAAPADDPEPAEPAETAVESNDDLSVRTYSSHSSLGQDSAASFETSTLPVHAEPHPKPDGYSPRTQTPEQTPAAPEPATDAPAVQEAQPVQQPDSAGPASQSARRGQEAGPEPAAALTADRLLTHRDRPPVGGWRLWVYKATFGYLNVGDSDRVRLQRALEHRINVRLGDRTRYVPVLSRKGGVGKTTITTLLGMVLAENREDRIIALDANPDRGTLSDRSPGRANYTARQLVNERFAVDSFAQLSNYVAREGSRLDVLASETDPTVGEAFDEVDYRAVTEILGRYYSIVLTDSGTGMVHSVMKGTLEKADTVVLVSGGSVDEARLASETLSWLQAHGRDDLVARAIVVINMSSGEGHLVNIDQIEEHFSSRVKTVVKIPYDRHLAEGARVDLAQLRPATRAAITELAALVIDELQK